MTINFVGISVPNRFLRSFDQNHIMRAVLLGSAALAAIGMTAPAQAAGSPYIFTTTGTYSTDISLQSPDTATPTQLLTDDGVTETITGAITEASAGQSVEVGTTSGTGTVILANQTNSWTGTTTIDSGATLALTQGSTISSSPIVNNGTFDISGSGVVSGVNTIVYIGGYPNFNESTTVGATGNADTLNWLAEGYGTTGTIAFTNSNGVITDVIVTTGGDNYTFYGVLSGNALIGTQCAASGTVACLPGTGTAQDLAPAISGFNGGLGLFGSTLTATVADQYGTGTTILSLAGSGNVVLGSNILTIANAADTFSGAITGTGGLSITGGTETLTGASTYTGATTVASGAMLALAGSGSIAASSGVAANGTFDISQVTDSASIISLTGSGTVALGGKTLLLTNAADTFGGALAGTGSLGITGGSEMLTGTSSYTGATTIASGAMLALAGSGSIAASSGIAANGIFDISQVTDSANIASLSGSGTVALGTKTLLLTNAANTFSGAITGTGGLNITGGTETLSGTSSYTGATSITSGGTLDVEGSLASAVAIASASTLVGTGTVGAVTVNSGGILHPGVGTNIGTLTVTGDLVFAPGAIYQVNATPTAASQVNVGGSVNIQGGAVNVLANGTTYQTATTYHILTATGGVSGTFGTVDTNLAFLTPTLAYGPDGVDLTLTRNHIDFSAVAITPNQVAVGTALSQMALSSALPSGAESLSAAQARQAFDSLSGEIHASLPSALIRDSKYVRDSLLADGQRTSQGLGVFGDLTDTSGQFDGTADSHELNSHRKGVIAGIDYGHDDFRAGIATGYSDGTYRMTQGDQASVKSYYAGGQVQYRTGQVRAQVGAAYSWHHIDTSRSIAFGAFAEDVTSQQKAHTLQAFGELGYAAIQNASFSLEPFVGYAHVHSYVPAATEYGQDGNAAALSIDAVQRTTNDSFAGIHLKGSTPIGSGGALFQPHFTLAWQHAWGDRAGTATVALAGADSFDIVGSSLAGNSVKMEGGFDVMIGRFSLGASYIGAAANTQSDQGAKVTLTFHL